LEYLPLAGAPAQDINGFSRKGDFPGEKRETALKRGI